MERWYSTRFDADIAESHRTNYRNTSNVISSWEIYYSLLFLFIAIKLKALWFISKPAWELNLDWASFNNTRTIRMHSIYIFITVLGCRGDCEFSTYASTACCDSRRLAADSPFVSIWRIQFCYVQFLLWFKHKQTTRKFVDSSVLNIYKYACSTASDLCFFFNSKQSSVSMSYTFTDKNETKSVQTTAAGIRLWNKFCVFIRSKLAVSNMRRRSYDFYLFRFSVYLYICTLLVATKTRRTNAIASLLSDSNTARFLNSLSRST